MTHESNTLESESTLNSEEEEFIMKKVQVSDVKERTHSRTCTEHKNCYIFQLDSAATAHCIFEKKNLINVRRENISIRSSSGHTEQKVEIGDLIGNFGSEGSSVQLQNIVVSPMINDMLLSEKKLQNEGFSLLKPANETHCIITDSQGNFVYCADLVNGFYEVHITYNPTHIIKKTLSSTLWHKRLGHIHHNALQQTLQTVFPGSSISKQTICEDCVSANLTQKKHSKIYKQVNDTDRFEITRVFQKIYADTVIIGKKSLQKEKYLTILTDGYSRWRIPIITTKKSKIAHKIIETIKQLQNEFNLEVSVFKADKGSEFINKTLQSFFSENGTRTEFSSTTVKQENGIAEKSNDIVQKVTRALLHSGNIPYKYWSFAVRTACYLLNRRYQRSINGLPFVKVYNKLPRLEHLRTYGAHGYCLHREIDPTRISKLDKRGVPCRLIGYSNSSLEYIVLLDKSNKIVKVSTARFLEDSHLLLHNGGSMHGRDEVRKNSIHNNLHKHKRTTENSIHNNLHKHKRTTENSKQDPQNNFCDINESNILQTKKKTCKESHGRTEQTSKKI